jgi:hypothetical protein
MKKSFLIALVIMSLLLAVLAGCANKTVYIDDATETISVDDITVIEGYTDEEHRENIALGRAAGEAYGFNMDDVPSWEEVKAAREADYEGCAKCFWVSKGILHTEVDGIAADLTPEQAVDQYKDNPDFMREYIYLMQYRDYPDPVTYFDEEGEIHSITYDPDWENWDGPSDS